MPYRRCINTAAAADYLGVSETTLNCWRRRGVGPAYFRLQIGQMQDDKDDVEGSPRTKILYGREDLAAWLESYAVRAARLPRPVPGRLPGGKNRRRQGDSG